MAKVNINDKEYDTDDMSEEAQKQLVSLQFAANEVKRLQSLSMYVSVHHVRMHVCMYVR